MRGEALGLEHLPEQTGDCLVIIYDQYLGLRVHGDNSTCKRAGFAATFPILTTS